MLDYYSEFPGPSLEHCKKTIQSKFYKTKVDDKYKSFLTKIKHGGETQAKLINSAFECADVFIEGVNKYSFSGWLVFGIPDVMYFLKINIEKYKFITIYEHRKVIENIVIFDESNFNIVKEYWISKNNFDEKMNREQVYRWIDN